MIDRRGTFDVTTTMTFEQTGVERDDLSGAVFGGGGLAMFGFGPIYMEREEVVAGRTCVVIRMEPDGSDTLEFAVAEGLPIPCFSRYGSGADAVDLHAYLSDPEVYRFEPGEPVTLAEAEGLARERAAGTDFWAIELTATGTMIGHLYFARAQPAEWRTWELGYTVSPAHQRRGYASEAATALLRAAFAERPVHRVVAHCNPDNPASWRLLERVGFRREALSRKNVFFRRGGDGAEAWTDSYLYAMLEEEAEGRLTGTWT